MHRSQLLKLVILFLSLLLAGCLPQALTKQLKKNINEQQYIDARLAFTVKHPLDWQLQTIPVSSPTYRADTVLWRIPATETAAEGQMLIRSRPLDLELSITELLQNYLTRQPKLTEQTEQEIALPSGTALKLIGHNPNQGQLIVALKGQNRDFLIALTCPNERFATLLPVFEEIVASLAEVTGSQQSTSNAQ